MMAATASRRGRIRLRNGPRIEVREQQAGQFEEQAHESICALCGGKAFAIGGAIMWCHGCLARFIEAGLAFVPSITVRRIA